MQNIFPNTVVLGRTEVLIPGLQDESIRLVVTSPPYAEQREHLYDAIPVCLYPEWTVGWMDSLRPKLTPDASVLINIREHVRNGVMSDYVHRTRLALRDAGWFEIDELIWFAPDKPPLGSFLRPRRAYERVLWFAPSRRPYVDLYAVDRHRHGQNGQGRGQSIKINLDEEGPTRLSERRMGIRTGGGRSGNKFGTTLIHAGQGLRRKNEFVRVTDVFRATIGSIDKSVMHPAMFPRDLPRQLILTFSQHGDVVLDPFIGSGTTALAAQELGRQWIGFDSMAKYVRIAKKRLGLPLE